MESLRKIIWKPNSVSANILPEIHAGSKDAAANEIENEKEAHRWQAEQRTEVFEDIIYNMSPDYKSPKYILFSIIGILPALSSKWVYTLIPTHNVIQSPQYWYELPPQLMFGFLPIWATYSIFSCSYFMNIKCIRTPRNIITVWSILVLLTAAFFGTLYLVWVYLLKYQFPLPLMGYAFLLYSIMTVAFVLWFRFPSKWRSDVGFNKRLKIFLVCFFLSQLIYLEYAMLTKMILSIPIHLQWIVAIFLPFIRELNLWIHLRMFKLVCDGDISSLEIACGHGISTSNSFFLAYTVGSIATITSIAMIIGTDFLINLSLGLRVIYLWKKKERTRQNVEKQIELLQTLVINEMVEFWSPVCYLLCFITAYYGPNAWLIGDIGNGYWQYTDIKDVKHTITVVAIFLVVDLGSLFVCTILLWMVCRINLYKVFGALQKEFGFMFSANLAVSFNLVS